MKNEHESHVPLHSSANLQSSTHNRTRIKMSFSSRSFSFFYLWSWLFRQVAIIKKKEKQETLVKGWEKKDGRTSRWRPTLSQPPSFCHYPAYRLSFPFLSLSRPFLSSHLVHVLFPLFFFFFFSSIHSKTGRTESRLVSNRKCFFRPASLRVFFSPSHFSSLLSNNRR